MSSNVACTGVRAQTRVRRARPRACGLRRLSWVLIASSSVAASFLPATLQAQAANQSESAQAPLPAYGARAKVPEAPAEPATASEPELQRLNERLGPRFSLTESLPGTLPVFSGVPYLIVRGAPPSGTRSYYDGVLVPSLYHVALGPRISDARLFGALHFHPAVAPARFGRRTGGVIAAEGPDLHHREGASDGGVQALELSLLDASGLLIDRAQNTTLAAAWRVGNPGLIMDAIGVDATLSYFDYQVRYEAQLSERDRVIAMVFGAGDQLGERAIPEDDISLRFHRSLLRFQHSTDRLELSSELVLGYDESTLGQELTGTALRIAPNVHVTHQQGDTRVRIGTDTMATFTRLTRPVLSSLNEPGSRGRMRRTADFTLDPQDFIDNAPLANVPTRHMLGVYGELQLRPLPALELELGARADLWLTGAHAQGSANPNARVSYQLSEALSTHAGVALTHGPRAAPVPLPGLEDVALDLGLERALQSEAGVTLTASDQLRASATLFYTRYLDVVYLELILDCEGNTDPRAAQAVFGVPGVAPSVCRDQGLPTADGDAYGLELHVQRDLSRRLSGFLSYTLAFARATAEDGTRFTPQSDVRHVANLVMHYDLGHGFGAGARMHFRTGKNAVNTIFDAPLFRFERVEYRLPSFFRADLHATYAFRTSFARMEASLGFLNLTFSREATNRDCFFDSQLELACRLDYQPAIVLPNVGLRAEL